MSNQTSTDNQPLVISTVEPAKFESIGDTAWVTTRELAEKISSVFGNIFPDFAATVIEITNDQNTGSPIVAVSLLFKILPEGSYNNNANTAFSPISHNNGVRSGPIDRFVTLTTGSNAIGIKVNMNDRTKKLIDGYCIKAKSQNVDYNRFYNTYMYNGEAYIALQNLDVIKLIEIIYGTKDDNDTDLIYQVFPLPPIVNYGQYDNKDSVIQILSILRVNAENNERVARWFNMSFGNNSWFNNPNTVIARK